jgi:hypothetical protein
LPSAVSFFEQGLKDGLASHWRKARFGDQIPVVEIEGIVPNIIHNPPGLAELCCQENIMIEKPRRLVRMPLKCLCSLTLFPQ